MCHFLHCILPNSRGVHCHALTGTVVYTSLCCCTDINVTSESLPCPPGTPSRGSPWCCSSWQHLCRAVHALVAAGLESIAYVSKLNTAQLFKHHAQDRKTLLAKYSCNGCQIIFNEDNWLICQHFNKVDSIFWLAALAADYNIWAFGAQQDPGISDAMTCTIS